MSQGNDLEQRFGHLLQPIRDLTKNWDIDIAGDLTSYLGEIDTIRITFDDGLTTLNFAEAALVIQGSACVYSKKVEYLYSLVYQALDLLANKKTQKQGPSVDADGKDADAPHTKDDEDEEFLTLDDIKEHNNIDMKNDIGEHDAHAVHVVPRTPMALVPLEEGEKGANPLLSRTGEILGSRNDFKMNTCNIHPTGTMLLDMSHLSFLDDSFNRLPTSTPFTKPPIPPEVRQAEEAMEDEGLGIPQDISMDEDNGGMDLGPPDLEDENPIAPVEEVVQRQEKKKVVPVKPYVNPWQILDPHQVTIEEKPFKKGRPFKIPPSLETDTTKRKRKKSPQKMKELEPIDQFIEREFYAQRSKFPKNPLKRPTFPEFEDLYWDEFKRRQAILKQHRKKLAAQDRLEELAEAEDKEREDNEGEEDHVAGDGNFGAPSDDGDDDIGALLGDITDPHERVEPLDLGETIERCGPVVQSYEDLVRHHVDGFLASAQMYAQHTDLSKRVSEWENNLLPKLQEEEEHGPYDIHTYGSTVINSFSGKASKIPFRNMVKNKKSYEIARLFLATLQLANNNNVEVGAEGEGDQAVDTMFVKLISTRRHYEELQEYRAPSIKD
ncbi:unnamed protein product [Owenia fusiformis]|uniref:Condensin-2 complex subunit H2 n=1 Tax=Owenia fusiformis TaxID=6347 RepID=A0A8J1XV04_OWEFU|nr:unnamed protein product [Owenia fusiformis]